MILSDGTLKEMLASGELVVEPLVENSIQCSSIDCTLGSHFLEMNDKSMEVITLDTEIPYREIEADSIVIPPKSFLLATTREYMKLPDDVTAFVEGRSSIGRLGLFIENAGWVDAGFEGRITLDAPTEFNSLCHEWLITSLASNHPKGLLVLGFQEQSSSLEALGVSSHADQ